MANYQQRGENSYLLTVSCGYDNNGKKIRKTKTIDLSNIPAKKRDKEAERQWILFKEEVDKGVSFDSSKMTFEDFINTWIRDYAEVNLAPKTLYEYKGLIERRILPALGHIKLSKLQPMHLNQFYNNLRENGIRADRKEGGLSEKTILHHHRLISSILNTAMQWQLIGSNPADRVKPPKVEKKEVNHFTEAHIQYILELLEDAPIKYKTIIYIAVFTGMRAGEIAGLEWNDIDMDNQLLKIHQSSQYLPEKGTFTKGTKTSGSNRVISIPSIIIKVLNQYKLWQNGEKAKLDNLWKGSNKIFTSPDGDDMYPNTPSKWFYKFLKSHNDSIMKDTSIPDKNKDAYLLPQVNFHGLRHTNATLLITQGVDVVTVSKRLGHDRASTTTDMYAYSLRKPDIEAANKLEDMFSLKANSKAN